MPNDQDPAELLIRMLRLKRYEQPPPGYFDGFLGNVRARIVAEENRRKLTWWESLVPSQWLRPLLAGAFGVAVVGVYFVGLTLAGHWSQETAQATTDPNVWALTTTAATLPIDPIPLGGATTQTSPLGTTPALQTPASVTPVLDVGPPAGLFSPGAGMRSPQVERAGFSVRGN